MTRRDFLQRFGMVGGSSLVMGAMTTWDLMGASAGPRPVWSGRANARVLVLGAGVTGLVVGHELGKLGYDYRILEARNRVGGVIHTIRGGTQETDMDGASQTCRFDEGLYLNGGAWRIFSSHTAVLGYCKELGVALEIFVNDSEASYLYYEGETSGALSGQRVRLREARADLRGQTMELLAKAVHQGKLDVPLSTEDKERLLDYLVAEGYLDTPDYVYRARGSRDPYDMGALLQAGFANRLRSAGAGQNPLTVFQPLGGMDQLPMALARAMPGRITLGAEVRQIRQSENAVQVVYQETATGTKRELTADYVVSCIPLSVLRGIDADLSPEMMDAVRATNYSNASKIGLQMRRRFWEEDDGVFGGPTYTNLPLGQVAFPSCGYGSRKGVILGFYGSANIGGLREKSNAERIEHVLANAGKIHPQLREEFENGYCVFWERIRYSEGAYATGGAGGARPPATGGAGGEGGSGEGRARLEQLGQPDNRIYIGCAAASTSPAWMEGAVSAAWRAVDSLHRRVMAS